METIMIPKIRSQQVDVRQGAHSSYVPDRDHNVLLRSTGHLKRDGRWEGDEDQFCVYRESEPLATGGGRTILCSQQAWDGTSFSAGGWKPVQKIWYPCIVRGWDSSRYYGVFDGSEVLLPPPQEIDFTNYVLGLNDQGTAWIVNNRPGNPAAGLGQTIGEAHQIPQIPALLKLRLSSLKSIGDNYLNVEFGWMPLLRDIQKMYNLTFTIENRLQKLVRNNGIEIRRRSKKKVDVTEEMEAEGVFSRPWGHLGDTTLGGHALLDGYYSLGPFGGIDSVAFSFPGSCVYKLSRKKTITTWNCGTFKYYVPDIGSPQWTARAKLSLFGGNPNPSTLWEVLPWSWLIDWFSNVGDIISNLQENAVGREALTNAYSMRTENVAVKIAADITWDGVSNDEPGSTQYTFFPNGAAHIEYSRLELLKLRQQASPFGFGVPSSAFTAKQWAILAALGISRLR
jgi:hypothetical protein